MAQVTRTIAGYEVTLTEGKQYIASRPMAYRNRVAYPVKIQEMTAQWEVSPTRFPAIRTILGLTYDEANDFLAEFNNGPTSFDGRIW